MNPLDLEARCRAIEAAFFKVERASDDYARDLVPIIAARALVRMRREPRSAEEEKWFRGLPPVVPTESLSQANLEALSRSTRPIFADDNKGLQRLVKLLSSTQEAITALTPRAHVELTKEAGSHLLLQVKANLEAMRSAALKAGIQVKRGRPKKVQKLEIALVVGEYYKYRTDKRPTVGTDEYGKAYGPFLDLLTTVFKCLGIEGGAEHQARRVCSPLMRPGGLRR